MRNRRQPEHRPGTIALARDVVLEYPRQSLATFMGVSAVVAIFANALFLQTAPHPAPLFAPKASPVRVAATPPDPSTFVPAARPVAAPAVVTAPLPAAAPAPARRDPIADIIAMPKPSPVRREAAAPVAAPAAAPAAAPVIDPASRKVMAAQRALTEFGYGQIKPTGTVGPETRAAVERFERARGLPPTGQLSDTVLRELAQHTGRKFD